MENRILINIMKKGKWTIIAVCDSSLIGKKYTDGKICLDLDKYRKFYLGEELEKIEDIDLKLKEAAVINVVGKLSVEFIEKKGFDVKNCRLIGKEKVPHIQIYRL
ncbi:MAG: DUF424 family protein [Candidatus Micrarchaeota archaeon]|nr:DUF424 family protein [Candidatus Micrarchaeota archaeon]